MAPVLEVPTYLYFEGGASRLVKTVAEAQALLAAGWKDTPAAFEAGYVPPAARATATRPPAPKKAVAEFPSWRYHDNGDAKLVKTAAEAAALGAGWHDSPAKAQPAASAAPASPVAPEPPAASIAPDGPQGEQPPAVTPDGAPAATDPESPEDVHKRELYAATVPVIAEKVADIPDVDLLRLIRSYEEANPRGARKGVLEAVGARLKALGVEE